MVVRRLGLLVYLLIGIVAPGLASADVLHVYGPDGTPAERRALAVIERADGTCADWEELELQAEGAGVIVEMLEPVGACARWIRVVARPPRDTVRLRALGAGVESSTAVAMGSDRGLRVDVRRRGDELVATLDGAREPLDARVVAVWAGGEVELTYRDGDWVGEVPRRELVGVVARSGGLTGAAAAPPSRSRRPGLLLLPSDLAVPAGGTPRTAAFLVVTDRRGRLSQNVPLRVQSERGQLRSLDWIEPGLAAVRLSVDAGVDRLDLTVRAGELHVSRDLPVVAAWPGSAELDGPREVDEGERFDVQATVRSIEGTPIAAGDVHIACGGEAHATARATCLAPAAGSVLVIASSLVDGRAVPLASRVVAVRDAAPPPRAEPPPAAVEPATEAREAVLPAAVAPPARPTQRVRALSVGALVHGGIDLWGRPSIGGGLRVRVDLGGRFALSSEARYAATPFSAAATPAGSMPSTDAVEGTRHAAELSLALSARARVLGIMLAASGSGGIAWAHEAATVGNADTNATGIMPVLTAAVGPLLQLSDAIVLDLSLGVRFVPWSPRTLWPESPARVFLEVGGAYAP